MKKEIQALTQKKENGKMEKERNTGITEIRIIKYMSNKIIEKMDLFYFCKKHRNKLIRAFPRWRMYE